MRQAGQQTRTFQKIGLKTKNVLRQGFAQLSGQIGQMTGALLTGQSQIRSFGDVVKSVFQSIISKITQMIAKMLVFKALSAAAGGPLGGWLGGLFGGGGGGVPVPSSSFAQEGGFVEEGGFARIHEGESVVTADAVEAFQEKIRSLGEVGEEDSPAPAPPDVTLEAPSVPPPQVTLSESSDPARGLAEQLSSALPEMSMPTPATPEPPESFSVPTGFFSELKESVTAALPEVSVPAPTAPEPPESFSVPTRFFSELKESVTAALPEMSVPSPTVSLPDIPPVDVPMPDGGEARRMLAASGIGTIQKAGASKTRLAGGEVSVSIPVEVVNQANEAGVRSRARTGR